MPTQFYRLPDLIALTTLSRPTIYRLISLGKFPPPVKISPRLSGWRVSEIDQWLAERTQGVAV